jgi:hypothetical protein
MVALLVTFAAVACGEDRGTPSATRNITDGLAVLAGEPGAATLTIHGTTGAGRDVPLADPATGWISVAPSRRIVATLDDGTVRVSDELRDDRPLRWRTSPGPDVELPAEPLYFATWSPDGSRIAAIASDFRPGSQVTVVLIDAVGDASLLLPVPLRPIVAPPAWLGDDIVLLETEEGFARIDTGTGDVRTGPPGDLGAGISASVAADGSVIALADPQGGAVEVRDVRTWLTGDRSGPMARLEAEGEVGGLALDRRGSRLAVVWQQLDGPGTVVLYARADGWREAARIELKGESARAVVDWLP